MVDFGLQLAAWFGGVFGAVVGFVLIGATVVLLALPYILMTRRSQDPHDRDLPKDSRYS